MKIHYPAALVGDNFILPSGSGMPCVWRPRTGFVDLGAFAATLDRSNNAGDDLEDKDIISLTPKMIVAGSASGNYRMKVNAGFSSILINGDLADPGPNATKNALCIYRQDTGAQVTKLHDLVAGNHRPDASAGSAAYVAELIDEVQDALKVLENVSVGVGIIINGDQTSAEAFPNNNKAANPDAPNYKVRISVIASSFGSEYADQE